MSRLLGHTLLLMIYFLKKIIEVLSLLFSSLCCWFYFIAQIEVHWRYPYGIIVTFKLQCIRPLLFAAFC